MSRLAAIEKGLYYPTPLRVVDLIAQSVLFLQEEGSPRTRLLDICAGEGHAAIQLAKAWNLEPYGVELDSNRAAVAQKQMTCLQGSYHCLDASPGAFGVVFLNPPYDYGQEYDAKRSWTCV